MKILFITIIISAIGIFGSGWLLGSYFTEKTSIPEGGLCGVWVADGVTVMEVKIVCKQTN